MAGYMPDDLQEQQRQIEQQRMLAQLLQSQGQAPQGQMVSGRYVAPSWSQYLNSGASNIQGQLGQADAEKRQKALAAELQTRKQDWMNSMPRDTPEAVQQTDMGEMRTPGHTASADENFAWAMKGMQTDPEATKLALALRQKQSPEYSQTPQYDQSGKAYVIDKQGNIKYLGGGSISARDKLENVNGVFVNPYDAKAKAVAPQDPNKPFGYDSAGTVQPNVPYQQFEKDKAAKGASNVTVKTDVKTGESLAGQVGPMMKDSASAAEAAVKQVDAAQRVVKAVDSDKLYAGPGANVKLGAARIGDMLGVTGKDTTEKISNTQSAIRGLAELTLQGRQQMKGQGAITESEGKLAEKAMSGDISELTAAEVKQLAKASERVARFNYAQHERKMGTVRNRPELQGIAPFYEAPPMIPEATSAVPAAAGGWKITPVN